MTCMAGIAKARGEFSVGRFSRGVNLEEIIGEVRAW